MIIDKQGEISIIFQENTSVELFLEELIQGHAQLKHENVIINLTSFTNLSPGKVMLFQELCDRHRAGNKSFVLVSDRVTYDEMPDELVVVPTLQEAKDLIEMEEIERDLEG